MWEEMICRKCRKCRKKNKCWIEKLIEHTQEDMIGTSKCLSTSQVCTNKTCDIVLCNGTKSQSSVCCWGGAMVLDARKEIIRPPTPLFGQPLTTKEMMFKWIKQNKLNQSCQTFMLGRWRMPANFCIVKFCDLSSCCPINWHLAMCGKLVKCQIGEFICQMCLSSSKTLNLWQWKEQTKCWWWAAINDKCGNVKMKKKAKWTKKPHCLWSFISCLMQERGNLLMKALPRHALARMWATQASTKRGTCESSGGKAMKQTQTLTTPGSKQRNKKEFLRQNFVILTMCHSLIQITFAFKMTEVEIDSAMQKHPRRAFLAKTKKANSQNTWHTHPVHTHNTLTQCTLATLPWNEHPVECLLKKPIVPKHHSMNWSVDFIPPVKLQNWSTPWMC